MNISNAMLMTAGLGTRLRPFTNHQTKALFPILGVPISQFALSALDDVGVTKVVANVHHKAEQAISGLRTLKSNAELIISDESDELLGSAGGIVKALPSFGSSPFFLANGDVLCDVDWQALANHHNRLRAQWGVQLTLTVFPKGPVGGTYREILLDSESGLITGLGTLQSEKPFFVGAAVIEPEAFGQIYHNGPCEFVPMVLEPAIRARKAGVFLTSGSWFDIGSPSLWWKTHLSLIDRLESGYFPSQVGRMWRKEIEATNVRVSERAWMAKDFCASFSRSGWVGSCYFGQGLSGSQIDKESHLTPIELGPDAILYGISNGQRHFRRGIGFGGEWVPISV